MERIYFRVLFLFLIVSSSLVEGFGEIPYKIFLFFTTLNGPNQSPSQGGALKIHAFSTGALTQANFPAPVTIDQLPSLVELNDGQTAGFSDDLAISAAQHAGVRSLHVVYRKNGSSMSYPQGSPAPAPYPSGSTILPPTKTTYLA